MSLKNQAKLLKGLFVFTLFIFNASVANAATYYAIISGNWNSSLTWSNTLGGLPGTTTPSSGDNVVIPSPFSVTINPTTSSCNNLTINTGATITLSSAKTININGTLTVN